MSIAIAPRPWSAPANAPSSVGWRFAQAFELRARDGTINALRWVLPRNCSIAPRQLLGAYLALCAVSLSIASAFWWFGATYVLGFAGLELTLVGVAFICYARHAADRETVTVRNRSVEVEQWTGPHVRRTEFRSEWVCVEPAQAQGSLVELAGEGRCVQIGRFVRPDQRPLLARDLRRALRHAQAGRLAEAAQESEMEEPQR